MNTVVQPRIFPDDTSFDEIEALMASSRREIAWCMYLRVGKSPDFGWCAALREIAAWRYLLEEDGRDATCLNPLVDVLIDRSKDQYRRHKVDLLVQYLRLDLAGITAADLLRRTDDSSSARAKRWLAGFHDRKRAEREAGGK